ncbi:MAG: hypothetical protein JWM19_3628 [Actinomycetia bacterium]|nr:hypothetical protein [Actinomycetes bacterium]
MSDTGNNCQGCGKPQKPGALYCTSCGLPAAGGASGASGPDTRTVLAPGKSAPPAGNTVPGGDGTPEWRPGQDWSPGAGWQQEQQVPWWLAPSQPGQQGFNQQGFNQGYSPQATGPLAAGPLAAGPQGTGPQGPTGPNSPLPSGGGRPSRLPLIAVTIAAAALLGAGAGAYVLIAHPFSSPTSTTARGSSVANVSQSTPASPSATPGSGTGPATTPAQSSAVAPTTPPATPPPATPPSSRPATQNTSERQAATTLAGLLSQSSSDRSAINDAYNDAYSCGGSLAGDQQTFDQAASNRQYLLNQLGSLPDAGTLPAQMLTDLTNAWQASLSVDNDYAQWAGDENSSGCTLQDASYAAAETPNKEATTDKGAFVSQWNTIAARYSLPQYRGNEI